MKAFSYSKAEKLKSRKQLEAIFRDGKSLNAFPVKVFYQLHQHTAQPTVKAGVGVSARHFKKAVQRNRIKRLLRECYRKEKAVLHNFLLEHQHQITVFFLYVDREMPQHLQLQDKMPLVLQKLMKQLKHEMAASGT